MSHFPRTYGNYEEFTDQLLTQTELDVPNLIIDRLRHDFEVWKAKEGWPADAEPTWSIRWVYTEPYEEQM